MLKKILFCFTFIIPIFLLTACNKGSFKITANLNNDSSVVDKSGLVNEVLISPSPINNNLNNKNIKTVPASEYSLRMFMQNIAEKKAEVAIYILEPNLVASEDYRKSTIAYFNSLKSLKIISLESLPTNRCKCHSCGCNYAKYKVVFNIEQLGQMIGIIKPFYNWQEGTNVYYFDLIKHEVEWKIYQITPAN